MAITVYALAPQCAQAGVHPYEGTHAKAKWLNHTSPLLRSGFRLRAQAPTRRLKLSDAEFLEREACFDVATVRFQCSLGEWSDKTEGVFETSRNRGRRQTGPIGKERDGR